MQKINLEKFIDLNHELYELQSLQIDDDINYVREDEGLRAVGKIHISGNYASYSNNRRFHEIMDVDIFAPYTRVDDSEDFQIVINDFDYRLKDKNIVVNIETSVLGVLDHDKVIEVKDEVASLEDELNEITKLYQLDEPVREIMDLVEDNSTIKDINNLRKEDNIDILDEKDTEIENVELKQEPNTKRADEVKLDINKQNNNQQIEEIIKLENEDKMTGQGKSVTPKQTAKGSKEIIEDTKYVQNTMKQSTTKKTTTSQSSKPNKNSIDDLFNSSSSSLMYKMIVCKEEDTYGTISQRYNIDEQVLRKLNRDKKITKNATIIVTKK